MNKQMLCISFCALFMPFFPTPKALAQGLDGAVEDINSTMSNDPFFGPFWGYAQKEPALENQSLNETLKKMESEAMLMQQEARRLRNLLYEKNTKKESVVNATKDTKIKLQKTNATLSGLLNAMDNNIAEIIEKNNYQLKEYEKKATDPSDINIYGITISLPGFKQDDIKVIISSDKKDGKSLHKLEVNGTKKVTVATEEEKEIDGKKVTIQKTSARAFTSSTLVNGRQKQIDYKDGTIKIKFDLPSDIDTQDGKYTMAFDAEKEALTLEFPRKTTSTKTQLKYTSNQ